MQPVLCSRTLFIYPVCWRLLIPNSQASPHPSPIPCFSSEMICELSAGGSKAQRRKLSVQGEFPSGEHLFLPSTLHPGGKASGALAASALSSSPLGVASGGRAHIRIPSWTHPGTYLKCVLKRLPVLNFCLPLVFP